MIASQKAETKYRTELAKFEQKRADIRTTCHEDLRRANRDTKLPVSLRCLRGELGSEKDVLAKEADFIKVLPGIGKETRKTLQDTQALLADAVNTFIAAIDSGVFTDTDTLLKVKLNLLTKYREPLWKEWSAARRERLLAYTSLLLSELDQTTGLTDSSDFLAAKDCLESSETALEAGTTSTGAVALARSCPAMLKKVLMSLSSASGSSVSSR